MNEGILVEALELAIKKHRPKLISLTPTFKNFLLGTLANIFRHP